MAVLDYNSLLKDSQGILTPEGEAAFKEKVKAIIAGQTPDEMMASLGVIDNRLSELETIVELDDIADMASMSYIAKKYFNRSRSWLYQRLNGNTVHGKPATFTPEERQTLAKALDDMSRKFKEKSLSILNG